MAKFADYPVIMLDLYGRERHPEWAGSDKWVEESYTERRLRADLMLATFQYFADGALTSNRRILIDVDPPLDQITGPYKTVAVHLYGGRPQGATVVDLNGRVIADQVWERPEQIDEVLSNIFGLEPGF